MKNRTIIAFVAAFALAALVFQAAAQDKNAVEIMRQTDEADQADSGNRFAYLAGEIITSNTDTLYLGASYPLTDLMDISLYSIINGNDPSVIFDPWLVWDILPGWKLSTLMTVPFGEEDSSLGRMGVSGLLRLRFSF